MQVGDSLPQQLFFHLECPLCLQRLRLLGVLVPPGLKLCLAGFRSEVRSTLVERPFHLLASVCE